MSDGSPIIFIAVGVASSLPDAINQTYLLKHEGKLNTFFRNALHIKETVEFKVQIPRDGLLLLLSGAGQSFGGRQKD